MDFAQMKMITHDTNVTPNQGGERRQPGRADRRQADPRGRRGGARRRCSGWPRRSSASPVASLTVEQGRRLGRRQDRHLRRADRRQAVQHDDHRLLGRRQRDHAGAGRRGLAGTKPVSQYKLVGTSAARASTSRPRSPASTPTSRTSASRGCSTAASCGRAARAPTATARRRRSLSVDESSIKHIPGAQVVQSTTSSASSRRRSTTRSRRGAAEGEVGADAADAAGRREPLEADARPATAPARRRPRIAQQHRQRRHRVQAARVTASTRPTSTTTPATCRSARRAASPT